jgi:carbamoyltransferase
MKAVLGLKLDPWHDTGAALLYDDGRGVRVVALSQERLDRVKHSRAFPLQAINYCLKAAGLGLEDLSLVVADFIVAPTVDDYFKGSGQPEPVRKREFFAELEAFGIPVVFAEHHLCHAASSYYCTEWDEAAVLVIDGHGSYYETQTLFQGRGNSLTKLATSHRPGIGWMYGVVTECLLGFAHLQEGKTMGLAGWADHGGVWGEFFKKQSDRANPFASSYEQMLESGPVWKLKPPPGLARRDPNADPTKAPFAHYAFAAQEQLESSVMELVRAAGKLVSSRRLGYAGGVALNIPANRQILDSGVFSELFIQPAASDSGIPLGAALLGYHAMLGGENRWRMDNAFLGRDYSVGEIEKSLTPAHGHPSQYSPDVVAKILANNYLMAWFQGPSEFGPRALGHRSILCCPKHPQMKAYLNREVKHREMFRPFAPIVPLERQRDYFDLSLASPYMLLNSVVHADKTALIPATVHADGTARVQSVCRTQLPEVYELLHKVGSVTGTPLLLNTSLNLAGEPIVESPADALDLFVRSKLDAMVLGDHLLTKVPVRQLLETTNPHLTEIGPVAASSNAQASAKLPDALQATLDEAIKNLQDRHYVLAELRLQEILESDPSHEQAKALLVEASRFTACRSSSEWRTDGITA